MALLWLVERFAAIPLFGGIVRRYEQHYDEVNRYPKPLVSERVSDFWKLQTGETVSSFGISVTSESSRQR